MTGHLLAVGLAGSIPLVCIWLEWREYRRDDPLAGRLGRKLARVSMHWLSLGIVLGLVNVLLSWRHEGSGYFTAWEFIPRGRFEFGVAELAFYYACMVLYVWSWGRFRWHGWHRLVALLAATDLLYHFPPLFAAITALTARPELRGQRFVALLADPEILTRTIHFCLASLAVSAVYAAWRLENLRDPEPTLADALRIKRGAARLALAAGCLQLPVGFVLVVLLPDQERGQLLGGSWLAGCLMASALAVALGLLHHLSAIALAGGQPGEVRRSALLLALTFLLMVAVRQYARAPLHVKIDAVAEDSTGNTSSDIAINRLNGPVADRSATRGPDNVLQDPSPKSAASTMPIITLKSPKGSSAKIHADFGFNCYSFLAIHGGKTTEVLWSVPDFESGRERASGSGNPILFPFAGRIEEGSFEFEGRTYELETGDGRGNAIHGFVLNRPWRVTSRSDSEVTAEFQASVDAPDILDRWPSDFHISATYELAGNTLHNRFVIRNPGQGNLPFGLGTHPYFRLPLGTQGTAEECVVTVPISESWELVDLLPTGKKLHTELHDKLAAGMPFSDTKLDDVFTGVKTASGQATAWIHDAANGRMLRIVFDESFRECVVYNPPHREAICIEPYTCVPDAFRLSIDGQQTGLRVLGPGEVFSAAIAITLE